MARQQSGYNWKVGRSWYGRWREDVFENGRVVRKQVSGKLAEVCDRYRSKADVRPLLADKLRPLNEHRLSPESTLTLAQYAKDFFLPHIERECKPSTTAGYKGLWHIYLVGQRDVQTRLRDFRCVDATNLLADIHRKHGLGRTTLKHVKSFLSGMFTYAKRQGVLDGMNPVRDAGIP